MYGRKLIKMCTSILVFMILEFIVSLAVSIFLCRGSCGGCRSGDCCSAECCDPSLQGEILFNILLL